MRPELIGPESETGKISFYEIYVRHYMAKAESLATRATAMGICDDGLKAMVIKDGVEKVEFNIMIMEVL